MITVNTWQGEWTIVQARNNADFREVKAWAGNMFGSSAWSPRWVYLAGDNFGFLSEEDAVMFALRWA
jgi:hypothetical protein